MALNFKKNSKKRERGVEMKKIYLFIILVFLFTGCGTMMEPSRKTVTIQSATPVKAYVDGKKFIGEGKVFAFNASNRSRSGDEYVLLKEVGNEENVQTVYLDREYNPWATWNFLFAYGLPYIIDYPSGGTGRLANLNYYMPDFSMKNHSESSKDEEVDRLSKELEKIKLKNEIKKELELERTKERVLKLEATS